MTRNGRLVLLSQSGRREVVAIWRYGWKRLEPKPVHVQYGNSDTFVVW
jgi:hypothetical protein